QLVHLVLEVALALQQRGAGDRSAAAGDDARRHPLGVGVDRREIAGGPHAMTPRSTASASSSAARSAALSGSRGGRVGPPVKPTASWAALKYWTSLGVMSKRAIGRIRRYTSRAASRSPARQRAY